MLEASPLPIPPLRCLGSTSYSPNTLDLLVSAQSREDLVVNGAPKLLPFQGHQPVVLLLDDVLDPGNLGAILRSAYFLGVCAVVLTDHCAPLNPLALKASAGAAEALSIFRVPRPDMFLQVSANAGWNVICGVTPSERLNNSFTVYERQVTYHGPGMTSSADIDLKLSSAPQIVVVGGEGRGLRNFITRKAHSFLEFPPAHGNEDVGVDSLNVSVASAMVLNEIVTRIRVGENSEFAEKKVQTGLKEERILRKIVVKDSADPTKHVELRSDSRTAETKLTLEAITPPVESQELQAYKEAEDFENAGPDKTTTSLQSQDTSQKARKEESEKTTPLFKSHRMSTLQAKQVVKEAREE